MKPMKPMSPMQGMKPMKSIPSPERWWPESLGSNPQSAGGQNEIRYAFFGDSKRLAVETGEGNVRVYDTAEHRISGIQQQQRGEGKTLVFTSEDGEVDLDALKSV